MRSFFKKNNGEVIVEATIIFPIVILCVFLMVFVGNAYLQKCRVESVVSELAIRGAAQCADPLGKQIAAKGSGSGIGHYEIEPYRYLLSGISDDGSIERIKTDVRNQIDKELKGMSSGLFAGMKPRVDSINVEYNNFFVYSTFTTEVKCSIPIPMKLPGMTKKFSIKVLCRYDVPVSDTPEFIRNINMVDDYLESYGVTGAVKDSKAGKAISDALGKMKEFIN